MKKLAIGREKMFSSYTSDKGLDSGIYKELLELSIRKYKSSNLKLGKRFKQRLHQRRSMDDKHIKRCRSLLVIREMHYTPITIANIFFFKADNTKYKEEFSFIAGGNVKWHSHFRELFDGFFF